jgi:hypothetical protein
MLLAILLLIESIMGSTTSSSTTTASFAFSVDLERKDTDTLMFAVILLNTLPLLTDLGIKWEQRRKEKSWKKTNNNNNKNELTA